MHAYFIWLIIRSRNYRWRQKEKKIEEIREKKKLHKGNYRNNLDECEKERIRYNDRIRKQRQEQNISSSSKEEILNKCPVKCKGKVNGPETSIKHNSDGKQDGKYYQKCDVKCDVKYNKKLEETKNVNDKTPWKCKFCRAKDEKKQAARDLWKLQKVKEQRKVKQVEEVVDTIKQKFGTLQQFAKSCGETIRVIYRLCDTKEKKVDETRFSHKLASGDREEIMQHF